MRAAKRIRAAVFGVANTQREDSYFDSVQATDQLTTPVDSQVHVTDVAQPSADDCFGYRHHLYLRLGAAKRVPTGFAVTSQCQGWWEHHLLYLRLP